MPNQCEQSELSPCQAQKSFAYAVKWVLGIMIVCGGCGFGIAMDSAADAVDKADKAVEKAQNITVLENEMTHVRDELKGMRLQLDSITDIKILVTRMEGSINLTLEKLNQLERAE